MYMRSNLYQEIFMKRLNEKEMKRVTVDMKTIEETIGSKYYVCTGQTNREPLDDRNCAGILEQSLGLWGLGIDQE
jgi:hypothetical protein